MVRAKTSANGQLQPNLRAEPDLVRSDRRTNSLKGEPSTTDDGFRHLAEHAGDSLFVADLEGGLVYVNRAACNSLGYTREELMRLSLSEIAVTSGTDRLKAQRSELTRRGSLTVDGVHRRKDGSTFPVEVRVGQVRFGGQECFFGVARDVNERERAEQASNELAVLEERNRVAREIHDTVVQSLAAMALQLDAAGELMAEDPEGVAREVQASRELARDTLEEARRSVWDLTPRDLSGCTLIEAIQGELELVTAIGIQASLEVEGAEWGTADCAQQLVALRIIQEVLRNVRRHSHAETVSAKVTFEPAELRLLIVDDGVGFETKGKNPAPTASGEGFGLRFMQERARQADGSLEVRSTPNQGTQIEARIPIGAGRETDLYKLETRSGTDRVAEQPQEEVRVLVVDDHELVRRGIMNMLERSDGVTVVGEAGDGEEAIEKIRTHAPDVTLLDVQMPKLDGVETLKQLKGLGVGARVILLSAYAKDEYVFEGLRAGARGYLLKDTAREDLLDAIRVVHEGGLLLPSPIAGRLANRLDGQEDIQLTDREGEILSVLSSGARNKEIAEQLGVSVRTVKYHVENIYQKLDVETRTQAVKTATDRGLLNP